LDYCACGEPLDRDCSGNDRCPVCDPPCPGCDDGGMDAESEEGDYVTEDHVHFYQDGRLAVSVPEGDSIRRALKDHMGEAGYFPNVWFLSDHGNPHLITLDD
jgi:hypothetical protein